MKTTGISKVIISVLSVIILAATASGCVAASGDNSGATATPVNTVDKTADKTSEETTSAPDTDAAPEGKETSEKLTVKLGDQSVNGSIFFKYAQDKGFLDKYFADSNIEFEIYDFQSGPAVNEAIAANQLDFSIMGNLPAISGPAAGYGTRVVALISESDKPIALAVPWNSDIQTIADLKGRTIGLLVGSMTQYYVSEALSGVGLSLDDIDIINLSVADAVTSVREGAVDAGLMGQGRALLLESEQSGRIIDLNLPKEPATVMVAREGFLKEHPEQTEELIKALSDAVENIESDWDEFKKYYDEYTGSDTAAIIDGLKVYEFEFSSFTEEQKNLFSNVIKFTIDNGIIDNSAITIDDIIDTSAAKNAGF